MDTNSNLDIHAIERNRYLHCKGSKITWSAVFSGALIAFGLTLMFNLLTVGIGLVMYKTTDQGAANLALDGYLVTLFGTFIILFIGGWKAGKLIKIFPHFYCNTYQEKCFTNTTTHSTTQVGTPHTIDNTKCHICTHGMTHGFLAWVMYLIISLLFIVFFTHSTSLAFLKAPYLTLPDAYTRTMVANENTHNQSMMNGTHVTQNANTEQPKNRAVQASTTEVHNAGKGTIAIFLVLLFGALGASLGSYLGAHANKKCLMKKMHQV